MIHQELAQGMDSLPGQMETASAVAHLPEESPAPLRVRPTVLSRSAWDQILTAAIVPVLKNAHLLNLRPAPARTAGIWHAPRESGPGFAALLLADAPRAAQYLDDLIDQGARLEPLFSELFEPAARCLGSWWLTDRCGAGSMTVALSRLQSEARRLSVEFGRRAHAVRPSHAVLVATQPGEAHGLNATLTSELFWRGGWDVVCEFPTTDEALRELVNQRWFDVLELSSSGSLRRDHRLRAMRASIHAAQAASLNPALAVIVDGRSFWERPHAYLDVGANLACVSSIDALPAAERLVDSVATRTNESTPA